LWPALIVTKEMILIDGFQRLEAAKRRGDEEIEVEVRYITEEEALALAAKLNITHGKRLTILELAAIIKLLIEEKRWSQQRAAEYFNKGQPWISNHIGIANNLDTTLVTRVTNLHYRSARELAKLPQNKPKRAYRLARKMAMHDRRLSPSSRLVVKAVKKIRDAPAIETNP